MDNEKTKLVLGVEKPLWLAVTIHDPESINEVIGWTTVKPEFDNGFIDKGCVLIFDHIYVPSEGQEGLNFVEVRPGNISQPKYLAEFTKEEIDSLTKEGALTLLNVDDIEEISIFDDDTFIKYIGRLSFDARVFSTKNIYIVMGSEENMKSGGDIKTGEKILLREILDVYSRSRLEK